MGTTSYYEFVTRWTIPASLERVWHELMRPDDWPTWWQGVERVELLQPGVDSHGTGAIRRYVWRSRLPYRLQFTMQTTRIEPMTLIEGHATGELEGHGTWHLSESDGVTHIRYDWSVVANKWWMRWLAPIAKPVFRWNHDVVMHWGEAGLIQRVADRNSSKQQLD